jgi:hypothetical protein
LRQKIRAGVEVRVGRGVIPAPVSSLSQDADEGGEAQASGRRLGLAGARRRRPGRGFNVLKALRGNFRANAGRRARRGEILSGRRAVDA